MSVSRASESEVDFDGTLRDLLAVLHKRVRRASSLMTASDDPQIIDREMRYLRPFWEMFTNRKKLNARSFREKFEQSALVDSALPAFHRTELLWFPDRARLAHSVAVANDEQRRLILNLLRGTDIVVFNLFVLISRMKHLLGLESDNSFSLLVGSGDGNECRLMQRCAAHRSADGAEYRTMTCRVTLPDRAEWKSERDYSKGAPDPLVSFRLYGQSAEEVLAEPAVMYDGRLSVLKAGGGMLKSRTGVID